DGNTPAAFHAKCDNKGATIVVAKIENSEQIVGGYNPLYWNSSNCNMSIIDSFIYFFADKNNYETAKVSYSNGNEYSIRNYSGKVSYSNGNKYSIRNYSGYGPIFGGGNDLIYCSDGMWYCNRGIYSSYHKIDGMPTGGFNVNDYEVFQVIEK
ncbi:hypothetical protein RhiirA5_439710, partial [Rhizophagus irregularis]